MNRIHQRQGPRPLHFGMFSGGFSGDVVMTRGKYGFQRFGTPVRVPRAAAECKEGAEKQPPPLSCDLDARKAGVGRSSAVVATTERQWIAQLPDRDPFTVDTRKWRSCALVSNSGSLLLVRGGPRNLARLSGSSGSCSLARPVSFGRRGGNHWRTRTALLTPAPAPPLRLRSTGGGRSTSTTRSSASTTDRPRRAPLRPSAWVAWPVPAACHACRQLLSLAASSDFSSPAASRLQGFEDYVGSKTTVRVLSPAHLGFSEEGASPAHGPKEARALLPLAPPPRRSARRAGGHA